jgi:periplasmic divalent cation tolerance protein
VDRSGGHRRAQHPAQRSARDAESGTFRKVAEALEIHVTMPDAERAASMARILVGESLAACVNIVPGVLSIYRWEGRLQEEDEVLCLIKTRPANLDRVQRRIVELHPYDVPEILAFTVDEGSPDYLDWLKAATADPGP